MEREKITSEIIKKLQDIDECSVLKMSYYYGFEVSVYLYCRFGGIPEELGQGEELEHNLEKLSRIIRKSETLMNESINSEVNELWKIY